MGHITKNMPHAAGANLWIECYLHAVVEQTAEEGHVEVQKAQEDA